MPDFGLMFSTINSLQGSLNICIHDRQTNFICRVETKNFERYISKNKLSSSSMKIKVLCPFMKGFCIAVMKLFRTFSLLGYVLSS